MFFTPHSRSDKACMANGLVVVRAPIHSMSISYFRASSTCSGVATSVAISIPVSSFTRFSQGRAFSPLPSKHPGLVRGFQTPARNILQPLAESCWAVSITCSSVSAEQGPAIMMGWFSLCGSSNGCSSNSIIIICYPLCF